MVAVLLAVVVVALLVERIVAERDHTRERARLLNRIEARSTAELVVLNKSEEPPKPRDENKVRPPIPIGL